MVSKIKKHLDSMVWVLSNGVEKKPLQEFLFNSLYLFGSIFSIIVRNNKLDNCAQGISFSV